MPVADVAGGPLDEMDDEVAHLGLLAVDGDLRIEATIGGADACVAT